MLKKHGLVIVTILESNVMGLENPPEDLITLKIESLDQKGRGVSHHHGKTIFVENALPGEEVSCAIHLRKPNFEIRKAVSFIKTSALRTDPLCPHFGQCGGCLTQHITHLGQVFLKQRLLEDTFRHIGRLTPLEILAPVMGLEKNYRHRARLSVCFVSKKQAVLIGFREKESYFVCHMTSCAVLPTFISDLLAPLCALINELFIKKCIPQIEISVGKNLSTFIFRLLASPTEEDKKHLRQFIKDYSQSNHPLQFWLQPKGMDTAFPFYPRTPLVLDYELPEFDLTLSFNPTQFAQVNPAVNEILVKKAMALLDPQPNEKIADLFCGVGNFTLPIARHKAYATGIDGYKKTVEQAIQNAQLNGLSQYTKFLTMDLLQPPIELFSLLASMDKLLLDPPRSGAIDLIRQLPASSTLCRIVYVSCNPATLARDANILVYEKGYTLTKTGVINLFTHTGHIEAIACFEKSTGAAN